MTYVSRDVDVGYLEFWAGDFWGPMYQQAVYWFLGVLLFGFLFLAWIWAASPRLQAATPRTEQPPGWLFAAFVLVTAAGSLLLGPGFGLDAWLPLKPLFVVQPARIAFYIGYFALGAYADRRGWFRADGFRPPPGPWTWGCLLSGLAYLAFRLTGTPVGPAAQAAAAILFSAFCFAALMAGLALFQLKLGRAGAAWRILAANAFGVYYVHPLILYPLAWVFVGMAVPSGLKFVALVATTLLASLAVSALLLRRLPGLRRVF